jgi:hypothetical protein
MTPQVRSRTNLAARGYLVATVESKKRFPDKKKHACPTCGHTPMIEVSVDLFNCFDLICEHPQRKERMYVQVTDQSNHSKRRNKILASFEAKLVLLAGARILIQSWRKDEKINRYMLREEEIVIADFKQAVSYPDTVAELLEIRRKEKKPDLPPGSTLNFCHGSVDFSDIPF